MQFVAPVLPNQPFEHDASPRPLAVLTAAFRAAQRRR